MSIREIAAEALLQESCSLMSLARDLPSDLEAVVEKLAIVAGKVVFAGVGKSGHIARKIASTFSSIGTPACFLHPTEASHGDLGLLAAGDVLVLLSNSGETLELAPLVQYARRLHVPIMVMTRASESSLARAADWVLCVPREAEVCAIGLAPTTSALLMLGLGDALAVCLSRVKKLSPTEFHARHPAGMLGRQLLEVSDIMRTQLPLVVQGETMGPALVLMTEAACGCVGVVDVADSRRLVGIITDGDLRRHLTPDLLHKKVEDVMTSNPIMISEQTLVAEAMAVMNENRVTLVFVQNGDAQATGLVHLHDCLRAKVY